MYRQYTKPFRRFLLYAMALIFVLGAALMISGLATAYADTKKSDQDKLRQAVGYLMTDIEYMVPESFDVRWKGELLIEKTASYYALTLPHLTLHKKDPENTFFIDIGMIAINAMKMPSGNAAAAIPNYKGDVWSTSTAVPSTWTLHETNPNQNGQDQTTIVGRIQLGTQKISSLWVLQAGIAARSNGHISDFSMYLDAYGEKPILKLSDVSWRQNLRPEIEEKNGQAPYSKWSGIGGLQIKNAVLHDAESAHTIAAIEKVELAFNFKRFDPKMMRDRAKQQRQRDLNHDNHALFGGLFTLSMPFYEALKSEVKLQGVTIQTDEDQGLMIEEVTLTQNTSIDQKTKRPESQTIFTHQGLSLTGDNILEQGEEHQIRSVISGFAPQKIRVDATLSSLPVKGEIDAMIQALNEAIEKIDENPAFQEQNISRQQKMQLLQLPYIMDLLQKAGVKITLNQIVYETDIAKFDLKGGMAFRQTTGQNTGQNNMFPTEGTIEIGLTGLSKLIEDHMRTAPPQQQGVDMSLIILGVLQQLGRPDEQNSERLRYLLEIKPDGGVLLNGIDVSNLNSIIPQGQ